MSDQPVDGVRGGSPIPPPPPASQALPNSSHAGRPPMPPAPNVHRPTGASMPPGSPQGYRGAPPQPVQQQQQQQQQWQQQPGHQHAAQPTQQYPSQGFPVGGQGNMNPGASGSHSAASVADSSRDKSDPNFFRALFDFNFEHFVSIKFAKIIYIVGIVLNVLVWLGWVVFFFVGAAATSNVYGGGMTTVGGPTVLLGILALLFGWIIAVLNIVVLRVVIELVISQVRTAQNTTKLANKS